MIELTDNQLLFFLKAFFAIMSGVLIRVSLTIVKQRWASTYHHTMSYVLLPLITLTITTVISGNIALSLGMIGALSIVRFRNPVKNPFELVIFFGLVTIGIAMSVDVKYGITLALLIVMVILSSYLIEQIANHFKVNIYSMSFDEGRHNYILEVSSNESIEFLKNSKYIIQYVFNVKSDERHYRLVSNNANDLIEVLELCEADGRVLSIEFNRP